MSYFSYTLSVTKKGSVEDGKRNGFLVIYGKLLGNFMCFSKRRWGIIGLMGVD